MKIILKIKITLLFISLNVLEAQNLVQNPGFETITSCPTTISQISFATGWNNPDQYGSPDLYNNGGTCSYLPSNAGNGTTLPHSGNGLVGIFCYRTLATNREYLVNTLLTPMVTGNTYTVSFWAALATTSGWSVNNIGVYFSIGDPPCTNVSAPCSAPNTLMSSVTPQLVTTTFFTTTWTQYTFTYTATSNFNRMTVGRFAADNASNQSDIPTIGNTAYILFDDFNVTNLTVVPIELINFSASCINNNNINIEWTTASEINNKEFIIERSYDGINFIAIHNQQGNGNTTLINNYSYVDNDFGSIINKIIYYRLKQIDYDGSIHYHDIISPKNCEDLSTELILYPNPSNGYFRIINSTIGQSVYIFNDIGQLVYEKKILTENEFLNISELPSGLYIIRILDVNGNYFEKKLIKNDEIIFDNKWDKH